MFPENIHTPTTDGVDFRPPSRPEFPNFKHPPLKWISKAPNPPSRQDFHNFSKLTRMILKPLSYSNILGSCVILLSSWTIFFDVGQFQSSIVRQVFAVEKSEIYVHVEEADFLIRHNLTIETNEPIVCFMAVFSRVTCGGGRTLLLKWLPTLRRASKVNT